MLRLTFIGRLLRTLAVAAMRGTSTSTTAASSTALRPIATTFVALEQDSNLREQIRFYLFLELPYTEKDKLSEAIMANV